MCDKAICIRQYTLSMINVWFLLCQVGTQKDRYMTLIYQKDSAKKLLKCYIVTIFILELIQVKEGKMRGFRYYGSSSLGCFGLLFFIFVLPILIATSFIWMPILEFLAKIFMFVASVGERIFGEGNAIIFLLIIGGIFVFLLIKLDHFLSIQPTEFEGVDENRMTRTQYRIKHNGLLNKIRKLYNTPSPQDKIYNEKMKLLKEKIIIADSFLRNEINIVERFEEKKENIEKWFHQYYYLKEEPKYFTKTSVTYKYISLTSKETNELVESLSLTKEHYIPGRESNFNKEAAIQFIIEQSPVVKELKEIQKNRGYMLSIDFHFINYQNTSSIVYFPISNIVKPLPFYRR